MKLWLFVILAAVSLLVSSLLAGAEVLFTVDEDIVVVRTPNRLEAFNNAPFIGDDIERITLEFEAKQGVMEEASVFEELSWPLDACISYKTAGDLGKIASVCPRAEVWLLEQGSLN